MPHADPRDIRLLPATLHPLKLGLHCPAYGCGGTLCNHERRWWLRCSECKQTYLEDE